MFISAHPQGGDSSQHAGRHPWCPQRASLWYFHSWSRNWRPREHIGASSDWGAVVEDRTWPLSLPWGAQRVTVAEKQEWGSEPWFESTRYMPRTFTSHIPSWAGITFPDFRWEVGWEVAWHPLGPAGAEVVPWEGDEGLRCVPGSAFRGSPEMASLMGSAPWGRRGRGSRYQLPHPVSAPGALEWCPWHWLGPVPLVGNENQLTRDILVGETPF